MKEAIGFKEWQVVCEAIASGRQTLILRKGGIHEGRAGFSFAHESFFLFPTRFHAQGDQVREGHVEPLPEWQPGETVRITHHVQALCAVTLTDWEKVLALAPHHIYSESTVRDRFDWEGKGMAAGSIHAALIQVRKLQSPWEFPYEKSFGGCRSWFSLPEPPSLCLDAATCVVSEEALESIRPLLG